MPRSPPTSDSLSRRGQRPLSFIDRALYVPRSWACDPDRRAAAGIPDAVAFATKPELATHMITRALDAGTPAGWVAADEVYGADPGLRSELERRGVGYVLAIGCDRRTHTGRDAAPRPDSRPAARLRLAAAVGWRRREGTPLLRLGLDRDRSRPARVPLAGDPPQRPHRRARLLPLLLTPPGTAGRADPRRRTPLDRGGELPSRQQLTGLDQHQVRRWASWHRWTLLAMLAHAFLAVLAATERARQPTPHDEIPLACNEIRRLFTDLLIHPVRDIWHRLRWSTWRRRHQHRARTSHHRRRAAQGP
ncbi:MAG: hypothetical protein GEV03_19205 [Streptosporangiales bacterium]|nr:hypothetical protein [Streptosporangiales bacterium]